jgi:proto-oncogene serine/threonine-protein kinase mos
MKENLNPGLQREILFPSFGTSPSKAYLIDSPTNPSNRFSRDLLDDPTIKKLGKGSYGTVILGFWRGERVAMKKLLRRSSLENETHAMNLNHENVTKIREVFDDIKEDQNSAILVLEYVGQNSLQILIEQQPSKLTPKLTKSFLLQVAKGLKHCHDNLIVHLDIKPANVLVTSRGVCKLADFGCSHRLENNQEFKPIDVFTPGTPGYQAPEMFKLKIIHRKCDIFSFGILMWQLLVKEPNPYPESHPHTIIFLVVSEDSRPIKEPSRSWAMYEPLYKLCWDKDFQIRPNIQYVLKQLVSHGKNHSGSPLNSSRKSSGAGMRL